MGRRKPGKPGRRRNAVYTLQQLQPPGYDEWINVSSGFTAGPAAADPRLGEGAIDLVERLARLRPIYRGPIPMQAVRLDMLLDTGTLPVGTGGEDVALVPVEEIAARVGAAATDADIRDSCHRIHAFGGLLVEDVDDDVMLVRIISQPPKRPGEPWIFAGSAEDMIVPKTCVPARPGDLAVDEYAALAYIRCHMSAGTTARAEEFARHEGIGSVQRARELFAAVADLPKRRAAPRARPRTSAPALNRLESCRD